MRESIHWAIPAASLVLLLGACRSQSPEAQIRRAFETCRAAVEAGDAAGATAPLAAGFRGPEGLDRASARLYLLGLFRQEQVGVTLIRDQLAVQGAEGLQEVDLLLTSRRGNQLLPETSRRSFRLRWQKVGEDWRLVELQLP